MKNALYAVIIVLVVACAALGYFAYRERNEKIALGASLALEQQKAMKQTVNKPKPSFLMKGQKFSDSPLFAHAYLIAPTTGALSKDAQLALQNWTVASKNNSDGTLTVTLTPSEAEDVQQTYTLKTGYKLYFIELTLSDDKPGVDENRGDDMGVLVDQNDVVQ